MGHFTELCVSNNSREFVVGPIFNSKTNKTSVLACRANKKFFVLTSISSFCMYFYISATRGHYLRTYIVLAKTYIALVTISV